MDCNKQERLSTPLMLALHKSNLETIELMITNNLNVNNSGWSGGASYGHSTYNYHFDVC